MDLGIKDRVALITGGGRNIGRADCLKLAEEGAKVAVVDVLKEEAQQVAEEIRARGGSAVALAADVSDRVQVEEMVRQVESELGPVDILVNNAGIIWTMGQVADIKPEQWDKDLAVNLTGAFNVTRLIFPGMKSRGWGRVICMSSIAGLMGGFGQTSYSATKMGVVGFAKSLALEGARHGVTSNVIAPGIIGDIIKQSPMYERMKARVAMRREGSVEDVANAVAFLVSEPARYITGAVLHVMGGMDLFTF